MKTKKNLLRHTIITPDDAMRQSFERDTGNLILFVIIAAVVFVSAFVYFLISHI